MEENTSLSVKAVIQYFKITDNVVETTPFEREKTNITVEESVFNDLTRFSRHVKSFCGVESSLCNMGPDVTDLGIKLSVSMRGSQGTEIYTCKTQQQWNVERRKLIDVTNDRFITTMLLVSVVPKVSLFKKKAPSITIVMKSDSACLSKKNLHEKRGRKRKCETEEAEELVAKLKAGGTLVRNERQQTELEKFKKMISEYGNSRVLNEISIQCGACTSTVQVSGDRTLEARVKYFARKHFDVCQAVKVKRENRMKEDQNLQKSLKSWISRPQQTLENEQNDVDPDLIIGENEGDMGRDMGIYRNTDLEASSIDTVEASEGDLELDCYTNTITDYDIDTNSPTSDSDHDSDVSQVPFLVETADPLCIKLNDFLAGGVISRHSIFYKQTLDTVDMFFNVNHYHDKDVLEFHNTIEYLGGRKTANFIRGPMYLGESDGFSNRTPLNAKINLGGPSRTSRQRVGGGYTTESGIISSFLSTFLTLANASDSKVIPFMDTSVVKVFSVSYAIDGTALKAGFEVDERSKLVIGGKNDYDIEFVKSNPDPMPEFLRENVVTEANVVFLTSICNNLSMPVGVDYFTKAGKTGDFISNLLVGHILTVQTCQNCIEQMPTIGLPVQCDSMCADCLDLKGVCEICLLNGQSTYKPPLRACKMCIDLGKQCIKCIVLVITTDCEAGNKAALEDIEGKVNDGTINPMLSELCVLPDCVHVGKSLKCSFSNWYLLLQGERSNLSIIRTLRDDANYEVRRQLRKLLTLESVQNKDRMAVDVILHLTKESVLDVLRSIGHVVHDLVPERYRLKDDNKPGLFPHPVDVEYDRQGSVLFLDYNPTKKTSRLMKGRMHNPVQVQVLKSELKDARSLTMTGGICFICHRDQFISYVEISSKVSIKMSTVKSKASACDHLVAFGLPQHGTFAQMKRRLELYISDKESGYQSNSLKKDVVNLDCEVKPSVICSAADDILFCTSDTAREIYQITLVKDGIGIQGKVQIMSHYTMPCQEVIDICCHLGCLYVSFKGQTANDGGIISINLSTLQDTYLIHNFTPQCKEVYGVAPYKDCIVFTDTGSHQVKYVTADGNVSVLAGNGLDGESRGSASHSSIGQLMGIGTENSNIYVTDAQYGCVKLITCLNGTLEFLQHLKILYKAFSVHLKRQESIQYTADECSEMLDKVSKFLKQTTIDIQRQSNITKQVNGPDGAVATRTVKSVEMMARSTANLWQTLKLSNMNYTPNFLSCLTVMVENLHAVSHLKHGLPTKLEYARDFGRIHRESVKRIVKWAAHYYTHPNSYYPVPESNLSLADIPKLKKPECKQLSKENLKTLYDWARQHGKCVQQRTVRQDNTKYRAGTLPLNMYSTKSTRGSILHFTERETPTEVNITEQNNAEQTIQDDSDQYDSEDSEEGDQDSEEVQDGDRTTRTERSETDFLLGRMTRSGRSITISSRMIDFYL